ncbi:MAG: lipase family alpha/beta hydrolase [Solirubrobacterales bacterium]
MRGRVGTLIAAGAMLVSAFLVTASAEAITYAPVDQPGPALSVPQDQLDARLTCTGNVGGAARAPVLLVPGTGSNPQHNFGWNWMPALNDLGIPWCAVNPPENSLGDIQIAGEYIVNAIRTMYSTAGRKIAIIGHSQGGMSPRWALRFWPDTRAMVDDQIGIAPSNHGTRDAEFACQMPCVPANFQQSDKAEFIKAVNSYQETFPGISYTEIYTHTDEIVTPNSDDNGSSSLHGGGGEIENEAVQDICPLDPTEHNGLGTVDNVAYALAIDALDHPGPANPSRIPSSVCTQPFMPGVNPATFPTDAASTALDLLINEQSAPTVPAEPPLKCYVTASCPKAGVAAVAAKKAKCKKRKRAHRAEASKRRHCKKHKKKRY